MVNEGTLQDSHTEIAEEQPCRRARAAGRMSISVGITGGRYGRGPAGRGSGEYEDEDDAIFEAESNWKSLP